MPKLLQQHGLKVDDIDLWELNEAFACQVLYCRDRLGIPNEKLNVSGGAIAIGHPYGMSGARMAGHLLIEGRRRAHLHRRRRHHRVRQAPAGAEPPRGRGDAIESSPKPVVAAIHGTALGGGLETRSPATTASRCPRRRCGLPEVKLGLLPGAGGTQRLPRLVGPEQALEMVTSASPSARKEALALGILDELVEEAPCARAPSHSPARSSAENRPLKKVRDLDDKVAAARGKPEIFESSARPMPASSAASRRPNTTSAASRRP